MTAPTRRRFLAALLGAPLSRWLLPERVRTWVITRYDPLERALTYEELTAELKKLYPVGSLDSMVERGLGTFYRALGERGAKFVGPDDHRSPLAPNARRR